MMKNPHPARRRVYMLLGFFGAFLLLFFAVLYDAQVVHGSENRAQIHHQQHRQRNGDRLPGHYHRPEWQGTGQQPAGLYAGVRQEQPSARTTAALNDAIWRLIQLCQEQGVHGTTPCP